MPRYFTKIGRIIRILKKVPKLFIEELEKKIKITVFKQIRKEPLTNYSGFLKKLEKH